MQGKYHFMLLIDDYTRMTWVTFLKEKSKYFENLEMRQIRKSSVLDQTMGESLLQMSLMSFVRYMGLKENFQLQRLLSRMMLLK